MKTKYVGKHYIKKEKKEFSYYVAAAIYHLIALAYYVVTTCIFTMITVLTIDSLAYHLQLPEAKFFGLLLIGGIIDLLLVGMLAYPARKALYRGICRLERALQK